MPQPNSKTQTATNYLVVQTPPQIHTEQMYENLKATKNDFTYITGPESHLVRRKKILQQHPEIKNLCIPTKPYSMILGVILVSINVSLCYWVQDASWLTLFLVSYVIGATVGHTCHVLIHDFTHLLGHKNPLVNKVFAVFCNMSGAIPSAMSFGIYHADHHLFFSEGINDPDLPIPWEVKLFNNKIKKFIYFMIMTPVYAIRPMFAVPKRLTTPELINVTLIMCYNLLVLKFWGIKSLMFLIISSYFSIGGHPSAVHVMAEHYEFVKGQQSYDYLGVWNIPNLNVGYHIEHHDFPTCPWYNLPAIRAAAPEWYEYLPHHTSYMRLLYQFITDDKFNLNFRVVRTPEKKSA